MEIRRAGAEDATAAAAVAAATFRLACPPGISETSVAQFIDEVLSERRFEDYCSDPTRIVLLAEDSGAPIGYAMLVFAEPSDADVRAVVHYEKTVELSKIYVLADRHGGSVARRLMEASLQFASEAGADGIWLGVNQQNVRAQRFYQKSGFDRVGTKRFWVGDHWEDDYVFARPLTEQSAS